MRILYVSHKIITFILNEVVALKAMGHDVSVLTPHNDPQVYKNIVKPFLASNNLEGNVHFNFRLSGQQQRSKKLVLFLRALARDFIKRPAVTFRHLALMPGNYKRLGAGVDDYLDMRKMMDTKYDILYSSFSTPSMIDQIYFLSQVLQVPFVLAFRAHDIYENNNLAEIKYRENKIKKAAAIVTISHLNSEYAKRYFLGGRETLVIHSAVDLEFFSRRNVPAPKSNSIIAVARFHEQKGLIDLVRACHILANRKIPFSCTLIGRGVEEKRYREEIDTLKIPNITIINYLDREGVRSALSKASVFALPCVIAKNGLRDILPNALKEAMAMELPVVTSDISGIGELVEDGCSGLLTPPGKPEALANALERLLSDEALRESMGKQGRAKVEKDFNSGVETGKLERVFVDSILA
ncbi:MAG: glycosyltransferase family 4 protein [Desulforhopalus sp.]